MRTREVAGEPAFVLLVDMPCGAGGRVAAGQRAAARADTVAATR
jgi:hypothetical protein